MLNLGLVIEPGVGGGQGIVVDDTYVHTRPTRGVREGDLAADAVSVRIDVGHQDRAPGGAQTIDEPGFKWEDGQS
jgi:hypothetical protein